MSALYIVVYTSIIGLFAISIALSIFNWFKLAALSSEISDLESELEKKAQQFDSFRKERQASAPAPEPPSTVTVTIDDSPVPETADQPSLLDTGGIQIVRNVHGVFESTDQVTMPEENSEMSPVQQAPGDFSRQPPQGIPTQIEFMGNPSLDSPAPDYSRELPVETPSFQSMTQDTYRELPPVNDAVPSPALIQPEIIDGDRAPGYDTGSPLTQPADFSPLERAPQSEAVQAEGQADVYYPIAPAGGARDASPQGTQAESDVMDVVPESEDDGPIGTRRPREIALYSATTGDADFASAWKKLTDIMTSGVHPEIEVNFKNITFLYEKEIGYLEKMCLIVQQQEGVISFVNCAQELTSLFDTRPELLSHVESRSVP